MNVDFSALPVWRKTVGVLGLSIFFMLSFAVFIREMDIWAGGIKSPNSATGQVYPLHWMHGGVVYVTSADWSNFDFWYSDISPLMAIAFLIGFFSLFPLRQVLREAREAQL
jgi:hypothetical protein